MRRMTDERRAMAICAMPAGQHVSPTSSPRRAMQGILRRRSNATLSRATFVGADTRTASVLARRLAVPQPSLLPPRTVAPPPSRLLSRPVGVGASAGSCAVTAAHRSLRIIASAQHDSPPCAAPMTNAWHCLTTVPTSFHAFLLFSETPSSPHPPRPHPPPLHPRDSLTLHLRPTFHKPPFCARFSFTPSQ